MPNLSDLGLELAKCRQKCTVCDVQIIKKLMHFLTRILHQSFAIIDYLGYQVSS